MQSFLIFHHLNSCILIFTKAFQESKRKHRRTVLGRAGPGGGSRAGRSPRRQWSRDPRGRDSAVRCSPREAAARPSDTPSSATCTRWWRHAVRFFLKAVSAASGACTAPLLPAKTPPRPVPCRSPLSRRLSAQGAGALPLLGKGFDA